jgi:hypothetical protein
VRGRGSGKASGGLYAPREVAVRSGPGGAALSVAGTRVDAVREEWLVEDRWWTSEPLRRHYLELVLVSGRCAVVFRDLETNRWYEQR